MFQPSIYCVPRALGVFCFSTSSKSCPLVIGCDARGAALAEVGSFSKEEVLATTVEVGKADVLDFRGGFSAGEGYVVAVVLGGD